MLPQTPEKYCSLTNYAFVINNDSFSPLVYVMVINVVSG